MIVASKRYTPTRCFNLNGPFSALSHGAPRAARLMFRLAVNATIISIANNGRLARHIDSGEDLYAVANESDRSGSFPLRDGR